MVKLAWTWAPAAILAFVAAPALAAVVPASAAGAHVGQSVTVEGLVSEVHTARSGAETFIDVGGMYPNQAFVAVIYQTSMAGVGDVSSLQGKTVDITGVVQTLEGKPAIIVTARTQIRIK